MHQRQHITLHPDVVQAIGVPVPGSLEEKLHFKVLQQEFVEQFRYAFPDKLAPKTVVIVPSLTLDPDILQKVDGIMHYEERMLCLLMLLRMPRTHVIYVTSVSLDPVVVDYYLHLLPGITGYHARQRLTLLSCFDASAIPLTEKILARPRLMERIRRYIPDGHAAHLACFNVTDLERSLAVHLGIPVYGCDPELQYLGNKSMGRQLFRQCGLKVPDGFEDLRNTMDIAEALAALKKMHPDLRKAVIKMNEGFSGEGNAIYHYHDSFDKPEFTPTEILQDMPTQLKIVASDLSYSTFMDKFGEMGGIVEIFVEGKVKTSPSVQWRISPLGECDTISTHDQVLGGDGDQVFLGATFPAISDYAGELSTITRSLCEALRDKGVIGRFGIDFISVQKEDGHWDHFAIEINLRKGGTTHPFLMLNFLTDGAYDALNGEYHIPTGQQRFYYSTDNLVQPCFKGLTPHDLIEIAMDHGLMFDGASQEGVMFHMIGALSQYGKLGVVCIAQTPEGALGYYERTRDLLTLHCR